MNSAIIHQKLDLLPDKLKSEVNDFIDFLLSKKAKKNNETESKFEPVFGSAKGMFKMSDDFDEPTEDFREYM
jgi:hypothetical protein